jgi:Dolichyl-phosphate-mannose-protein mannosyltransferase
MSDTTGRTALSRATLQSDNPFSNAGSEGIISRPVVGALYVASLLLVLCLGMRLTTSWKTYGDLDTPSGVWATMAVDLVDGNTLYRPIISPLGYGGTRYAPLHPAIQAGLMRLGMGTIDSGYFISLVTTLAALGAIYSLIRRMGLSPLLAAMTALLTLSANCFLQGITKIHGDPLALALELWGLVVAVARLDRPTRSRIGSLVLLSIFFALAISAKITSVFGITAVLAWLSLRGRRREALQLFVLWAMGAAILIAATEWVSQWHAIEIFIQTAAGGGGIASLLKGPRRFASVMVYQDRVALGFWILGIAVLLIDRTWKTLPGLFFVVTTMGTVAIFGSPGTGINHLMSLQAASILILGASLAKTQSVRLPVAAAVIALIILGAISCGRQVIELRNHRERERLEAVISDIRRSTVAGPIYANDPLIPILAGQRPYLLDGFMARLIRQKDPASAAKLWDDLQHARFRAVVTHSHPADWSDVVADDAVIAAHLGRYRLVSVRDTLQIYLPDPK